MVSAAGDGDLGVVQRFLEAGVGVDAANVDGFTALMWAAGQGRIAVLEILLSQGAGVKRSYS